MSDTNGATRTITVTRDGGLRFVAEVRGHIVETDQAVRGGGDDSAPSPLELLPTALATCVALYAHQFCLARGIPDDELRVDVSYDTAPTPRRITSLNVAVRLPDAFPAEYRAAMERAVRTCPVHNTLVHSPAMDIRLEAPTAPEPASV